jgi:hypothetical protein
MTGAYDYDGEPISLFEWAELFARWPERRVLATDVGDIEVSTVWLGFDYSFGARLGVPLIYETMVFGGDLDNVSWHWPNRDAALAGHDQVVALVRDAVLQHVAADLRREFGFDEGER